MLAKNQKSKVNYFGRIMVLPLSIVIFAAFTFKVKNEATKNDPAKINAAINQANSTATYFENSVTKQAAITGKALIGMFINVKYADTNYLKTDEFKTKALVIIDNKEIGNVGYSYVEKGTVNYSSVVIYNPEEARKLYGIKGKYGVIKLTQKDAIFITADGVSYDDKKKEIKILGNHAAIKGNLDSTLIYVDGKKITPVELNEINPARINAINILKGDKLDGIIEAKGKTAVINVTLKPADLPEVVVVALKKPEPLYVMNDIVQENNFSLKTISSNEIERIDVLKNNKAIELYGEKGKNGVVKITTKNNVVAVNENNLNVTIDKPKLTEVRIVLQPTFYVGNLKETRVDAVNFKQQTEIAVTNGFSFVSAEVYFSGAGFTNIVVAHLSSSSLSNIKNYLDRCGPGTVITFDNVYLKNADDIKKEVPGRSYVLFDMSKQETDKVFTRPEMNHPYRVGRELYKAVAGK